MVLSERWNRRAAGHEAAVINGFSDLILELWGEEGRHARSAIGAAELPFGIPVEVEAIAEIG
jgi:enamine deaminase RidA (YjgF/YER057c/UK114 family)